MSFFSSLVLARSSPPPVVTAAKLGEFVRNLSATGGLQDEGNYTCQIKYGPRIDADDKTPDMIDWDESGMIGTVGEYPWDYSEWFSTSGELVERLKSDDRSIYRAYVGLGDLISDISSILKRAPSTENEVGLYLDGLSFRVGPVLVSGLGSEGRAHVGWMGLFFSGPGYFYPWSYREARKRAESVESVQKLVEVCRTSWPVIPEPASKDVIASRREFDDLWLYDDFALPREWLWFVNES